MMLCVLQPSWFWKALSSEPRTMADLRAIDETTATMLERVRALPCPTHRLGCSVV